MGIWLPTVLKVKEATAEQTTLYMKKINKIQQSFLMKSEQISIVPRDPFSIFSMLLKDFYRHAFLNKRNFSESLEFSTKITSFSLIKRNI